MTEDRWTTVDLPLLEFVAANEGDDFFMVGEVAEAIGAEPAVVVTEIERLIRADYLDGELQRLMTGGDVRPWHFTAMLAERGARLVGVWPAEDAYEDLLRDLDRRIKDEPEPERKSKLSQLRDSLAGIGKGVATAVITDILKRHGL